MSYLYKGFLVVYHQVCLTHYFSQCLNLQRKEIKSLKNYSYCEQCLQ